jgi:NADH-quinone oxidoreductase subunit F
VSDALAFLREHNVNGNVAVGDEVVVIGGGNAAIDAARTARRLGAKHVMILYRRQRAEMPAWGDEIDAADPEGVEIVPLLAPRKILRDPQGKVVGVLCQQMVLGDYDESGRRSPVEDQSPEFTVPCDQVIAAIGQSLDTQAILGGLPVNRRKGWIEVERATGSTSVGWIFAGGDAATGPASVVEAIGAGERAAVAIDRYLTGADHAFWRKDAVLDTCFDPEADPVETARAVTVCLDPATRACSFAEVERPWDLEVALAEAKRCLRCDYGKCPDVSAERQGEMTPCQS